jgi:hypothetical protein
LFTSVRRVGVLRVDQLLTSKNTVEAISAKGKGPHPRTPDGAAESDHGHVSCCAGLQNGDQDELDAEVKRDGAALGGDVARAPAGSDQKCTGCTYRSAR